MNILVSFPQEQAERLLTVPHEALFVPKVWCPDHFDREHDLVYIHVAGTDDVVGTFHVDFVERMTMGDLANLVLGAYGDNIVGGRKFVLGQEKWQHVVYLYKIGYTYRFTKKLSLLGDFRRSKAPHAYTYTIDYNTGECLPPLRQLHCP